MHASEWKQAIQTFITLVIHNVSFTILSCCLPVHDINDTRCYTPIWYPKSECEFEMLTNNGCHTGSPVLDSRYVPHRDDIYFPVRLEERTTKANVIKAPRRWTHRVHEDDLNNETFVRQYGDNFVI